MEDLKLRNGDPDDELVSCSGDLLGVSDEVDTVLRVLLEGEGAILQHVTSSPHIEEAFAVLQQLRIPINV